MFWQLIGMLDSLLHKIVERVLTALIYIAILVAGAHHVGWLDRWIWFVLEKEAMKAINGAEVTIGSFTIDWSDIFQGQITLHASNVIIHTPQRHEWQWDSPVIARVGKATVECNAIITIFHVLVMRREVPIEAYTIIVADAQVFVERRNSVINVYLLNPTLQLPPPPYSKMINDDRCRQTMKGNINGNKPLKIDRHQENTNSDGRETHQLGSEALSSNITPPADDVTEISLRRGEDASSNVKTTKNNSASEANTLSSRYSPNQQAQVLVNEMLQAVQVLGGAAARGQLPGAIRQQGLELVGRLQGFREQENLEEGIRVMQQMGKVAVESLQSAPQLILPQPDTTRERQNKIIYIRIGRIVAKDLRIFTKDSWINSTKPQEDFFDSSSSSINGTPTEIKGNVADTNSKQNGSWNKPIFIEQLVLRSSELCPPMSMKDSNDLPAIYQSVDKVAEVVWRRLLAEIAKSNTGKLFSTAMGEVLSVMVSNPQHSVPLLSASSIASSADVPRNNTNTTTT